MITLTPAVATVFGLLVAAVAAVWSPLSRKPAILLWVLLWSLSVAAGLYFNIVAITGAVYLVALGLLCYFSTWKGLHPAVQVIVVVAIIVMVAALFLHAVPGFNNPVVFNDFQKSAGSPPYVQHWNFDKASAGLILLAFFGDRCRTRHDWLDMLKTGGPIAAVTVSAVLLLALLLGHIKWAPAIGSSFVIWAWANLFFACIAEEMLFRGLLQKQLLRMAICDSCRLIVVMLVGILFGLAHYAGGISYVVIAAVAGTGYGFAYYRSGRIEAAILTHFILNALHFIFFTYPYTLGKTG